MVSTLATLGTERQTKIMKKKQNGRYDVLVARHTLPIAGLISSITNVGVDGEYHEGTEGLVSCFNNEWVYVEYHLGAKCRVSRNHGGFSVEYQQYEGLTKLRENLPQYQCGC